MASSLTVSLALGQKILVQYVEPVLLSLGIIGSLLNILLFSQRKLRLNSCCTCKKMNSEKIPHPIIIVCIDFLASSVATFALLLMGIIPQIYSLNHTPDPIFNSIFCKVEAYIAQSSAMLCRWLLTIACIDRCLLTSTNARLRLFSTVPNARKIVLLFYIIGLIFPIDLLIFIDIRKVGYLACTIPSNTAAIYHTIYSVIAGGLLPPFIMLICTKIIWKSLQLKRQRRGIIHLNSRENKQEMRDIQVLIMLLLQVIIFIIFTLPYMSFNLYLAFTEYVINKSADRLAIESFMQLFTQVTVFVHPAVSFYSNTLVSKTFRNELITLFYNIFTCGHGQQLRDRQRVGPSTLIATANRVNDLPMVDVN